MRSKNNWYKERLFPDNLFFLHRQILNDHIYRYKFASKYVRNKKVVDIACGCGYGSEILAKSGARSVISIDNSESVIKYAKRRYSHKNITYINGSANKIPLKNKSVDIVVSFETIEHLNNYKSFIKEIKRILVKGGLLIISTPNSEIRVGDTNTFHKKEFNIQEFSRLIKDNFSKPAFYFQKPINRRYLYFVNKHSSRLNNNFLNCVIDIYLKGIFIDGKIIPLRKLKQSFIPSVLINTAINK